MLLAPPETTREDGVRCTRGLHASALDLARRRGEGCGALDFAMARDAMDAITHPPAGRLGRVTRIG